MYQLGLLVTKISYVWCKQKTNLLGGTQGTMAKCMTHTWPYKDTASLRTGCCSLFPNRATRPCHFCFWKLDPWATATIFKKKSFSCLLLCTHSLWLVTLSDWLSRGQKPVPTESAHRLAAGIRNLRTWIFSFCSESQSIAPPPLSVEAVHPHPQTQKAFLDSRQ